MKKSYTQIFWNPYTGEKAGGSADCVILLTYHFLNALLNGEATSDKTCH